MVTIRAAVRDGKLPLAHPGRQGRPSALVETATYEHTRHRAMPGDTWPGPGTAPLPPLQLGVVASPHSECRHADPRCMCCASGHPAGLEGRACPGGVG